jgi:transcriptional regulator with XRE-family HTH domain
VRRVSNSRGVMAEQLRALRLRVGRNVQRLRRSRAMSQERFAELVGNTGKHIGQVERGEVNVGLDILARIAAALSVDITELFTKTPRRRRPEPPLFVANDRELQQIEHAVRSIRSARLRVPGESTD